MALVLTEVFTGGPEIALRVKEEQVERIFHLVSVGDTARADLMDTLQSMVKVCGDQQCGAFFSMKPLYLLPGGGPELAHQAQPSLCHQVLQQDTGEVL